MALPLPILDTRTFNQLVTEGQSIIPGSAPGWTDFNWHDPGITLIDLLAWLAEQDVYRLDRTTEAAYRSFLRLVGVQPLPPQVAETTVIFSLPNPSPVASGALPAGIQIGSTDGSIVFETTENLNVSTANLRVVLSGPEQALVDNSTENQTASGKFLPLGTNPVPGNALYLGFDGPFADQPMVVRLYVWAGDPAADRQTRQRLIDEWRIEQQEAEQRCPPYIKPDAPDWRLHYSVQTIWEYYGQPGVWTSLTDVNDETRALTLSGPVGFLTPPKAQQMPGGPSLKQAQGLYFIRCRLVSGAYECPPVIQRIAFNAVGVRHSASIDAPENLGNSTGRAQQTFQIQQSPVVPGSTKVLIAATAGGPMIPWREELVWDQVGPHERAYVLTPETGQISFGDGYAGRVPADGAAITGTYCVGGGSAGNVGAGTLKVPMVGSHNAGLVPTWNVLQPILQICQPLAAINGADAESMSDAMGRAYASLSQPVRGVTLSDFEQLALATPGVPIARAFAIANYDPLFPCFPALGAVTVVVVPQCPATRPEPSQGFLNAVARYIDRWRMITSEVHVVAPSYTTVSVSARLNVQPGVNSQNIAQLAQTTLTSFLNPLTGGPDGNGWPVGRSVYRADILALLNGLAGVVFVDELTLQADSGRFIGCDNLSVCPHSLVASGQHKITVNTWRGKI